MRCSPAQIPVPAPVHSTYCSLLLRPCALSSSPRKARGSSPASSNAGCDTHRHYITVPSAPRRRLSEKEEGEEEGSFTGSRSAPLLQPLQRAQAWKQAEGRKGAPSALRGTACLSRQALPPLSRSSRQEVPIGWRGWGGVVECASHSGTLCHLTVRSQTTAFPPSPTPQPPSPLYAATSE